MVAAYPEPAEGEADATAGGGPAGDQEEPDPARVPNHDGATPTPASQVAGRAGWPPDRLTVYRATYRWARKGPDRGRWEVDVRAEADAPLETVEDIVRGVHRRAGGEAEPERLSADAVRTALAERPWATPT